MLIDAFNTLQDRLPCHLVMVGGADNDYVAALRARCSAPSKLKILPTTSRPQDVLCAVDAACLPSILQESFPLAVLEAMACGVPTVCSDVGLLPELLGLQSQDLVAKSGDPTSLGDKLRYVRDNLQAMKHRGSELRTRALEVFGPDGPVREYEEIICGRRIAKVG